MVEILVNLMVAVAVGLWTLSNYGKRYRREKLLWILVFYVGAALAISWIAAKLLARFLRKLSGSDLLRRAWVAAGDRLSPASVRIACAALGKRRGLMCCAVVYAIFCRNAVDSLVLTHALLLPFVSAWLWSGPYLDVTYFCLCLCVSLASCVALVCALSLYAPIVQALRAPRHCMPADSYRRRCREAPPWATGSLEGAYSFTVGLAAPLARYREKWPAILEYENPERQAELSDVMTRSYSSNRHWARAWLRARGESGPANAREVAAAAWLSLHGPDDMREDFREAIQRKAAGHGKQKVT